MDARHPVVLWQGAEPFCCHHHLTADLSYPQSRKQRSQDASRTLGVAAGCAVALLVAVVCLSSGEGTDGYRTATLKHSPQPNRYSLTHTHTCILLFIHLSREAAAVAVLDPRGDASEHRETTARMAMSKHTHTHACHQTRRNTCTCTRETSNGRGHTALRFLG